MLSLYHKCLSFHNSYTEVVHVASDGQRDYATHLGNFFDGKALGMVL